MVPWLLRFRVDRQLAVVDEEARLSWMRVASQHPGPGRCPEFRMRGRPVGRHSIPRLQQLLMLYCLELCCHERQQHALLTSSCG